MKAAIIIGVFLVLALIAGAVYYATHPIPLIDRRPWVKAGHTDAQGNFVQTGTFRQADPDVFKTNGLDHVKEFASRVSDPAAPEASLIIASLDGMKACLLMRDAENVVVHESIDLAPSPQADPEHGRKVRKLFKELGIKEARDFVHDYNGVTNGMEDLEYSIGHDPAYVAMVITRLLQEVYSVTTHEGLIFTFERSRPPVDKGASEFIFESR